MNDLTDFAGVKPDPVILSHEERRRFFYYARWQAYQAMMMGAQLKEQFHRHARSHFQGEAMRWLDVARDVFPLTENGETCSIEDILNGKEPAESDSAQDGV